MVQIPVGFMLVSVPKPQGKAPEMCVPAPSKGVLANPHPVWFVQMDAKDGKYVLIEKKVPSPKAAYLQIVLGRPLS